jgi:putative endonuclease
MNWQHQAKRMAAEARGRHGENLACEWLREQGFEILAQRVKTKLGEVDIIARQDGITVFVEVKWRAREADRAFAIDERRLIRVARAAELLMPTYVKEGDDMRIDILLLAPDAPVRHIANAWMPF